MLTTKCLTLGLSLVVCAGVFLEGCKAKAGSPEASAPAGRRTGPGVLTKEEVGAILGVPVTKVEGNGTLTYKTATLFVEASIEVEQQGDSVESMNGARKATALLGGTAEAVPGLGDEAFFGAASTLYELKPQSDRVLKSIVEVMKKNPEWTLVIEGHTDNIGGDSRNQQLSARRAAAVKAALVERGVAAARLQTTGWSRGAESNQRYPRRTSAEPAGRALSSVAVVQRHS